MYRTQTKTVYLKIARLETRAFNFLTYPLLSTLFPSIKITHFNICEYDKSLKKNYIDKHDLANNCNIRNSYLYLDQRVYIHPTSVFPKYRKYYYVNDDIK